jgi:hypothetical protein
MNTPMFFYERCLPLVIALITKLESTASIIRSLCLSMTWVSDVDSRDRFVDMFRFGTKPCVTADAA